MYLSVLFHVLVSVKIASEVFSFSVQCVFLIFLLSFISQRIPT